jgi:hypothetical protein
VIFNIISQWVCLAGCGFDGEGGIGRLEIFLRFWDQFVAHSSFLIELILFPKMDYFKFTQMHHFAPLCPLSSLIMFG